MNIAICDDNSELCAQLETYIINYAKQHLLDINVEVYLSGEELHKYIIINQLENIYSLIFLDIEMLKMSGIEVSNFIRNELHNEIIQIIYISSHDKYAMQLFRYHPFDFLIKPFPQEAVFRVLDKCTSYIQNNPHVFHFQFNKVDHIISLNNIIYFETAYDKKIRLVHTDGEYLFYDTIEKIISVLQIDYFYKIHRGCVINCNHIQRIDSNMTIMCNEHQIPIPMRKQKSLINYIKKIGGARHDWSI